MSTIWQDILRLRSACPLVHNITNYVVMNSTANALLALGASPVMAHAVDEVEEMVGLAQALVLNIGTLSPPWIEAMFRAGRAARRRGIPIVLDPVGCGATAFRTRTAKALVDDVGPTVIRGNASEISALLGSSRTTRGVDSLAAIDDIAGDAVALARSGACVVSVSGAEDLISDGAQVCRIGNGHPMMGQVTGMGCTASAVTAAMLAVVASPYDAAWKSMVVTGIAGEIAAKRAAGPGSFQMHFLDALHNLDERSTERMKHRLQAPPDPAEPRP